MNNNTITSPIQHQFPQFTTVTAWECMGWNDFVATHFQIVSRTSGPRRALRCRRFQDSLQQFLLESSNGSNGKGLRNFWYQSGIELAMDTIQEGDPYRYLPTAQNYQHVVAYRNPFKTNAAKPCDQCARLSSVLYVDYLILYGESFCSVECAKKYQVHVINSDRWLRALSHRDHNITIPEDATLFESFFGQLPSVVGTVEFEAEYQRKKNLAIRPQVIRKVREVLTSQPIQGTSHGQEETPARSI